MSNLVSRHIISGDRRIRTSLQLESPPSKVRSLLSRLRFAGCQRFAGRQFLAGRRLAALALVLAMLAGARGGSSQLSTDFSLTYTQERSAFVGDTPDRYFYLRGATVDVGVTLWRGVGVAVAGTGLAATNLRGSIDIHHVQALVGPRYTYNLGRITDTHTSRKGSAFVEGKVGYTVATSGQYPAGDALTSSASGLTYQGGGGLNLHVYQRFDLRLLEVHYVRTQLPNGGTNVQNTLRFASGINFHFGL